MPIILIVLALILSYMTAQWSESMQQNHIAHVARVAQQQLGAAVDMSVNDAIAAAKSAAVNGQIVSPPSDVATSRSSCGVTDATNAAEPDCQQIIDTIIHFSGLTDRSGGNPAAGADGIATTVGNVNTATVATGGTFDRVLTFSVTARLEDPTQTTIIDTRIANGALHVISVCQAISNCGTQVAEVHFDGWRDSNGQHDIAAVEGSSGRCNPSDPTCSLAGADNNTVDPGVTPDDGRAHMTIACYDPNYVGNGGTEPGNRCAPTGNPAVGPENGDSFTNQTLTNDSATNGAYSR